MQKSINCYYVIWLFFSSYYFPSLFAFTGIRRGEVSGPAWPAPAPPSEKKPVEEMGVGIIIGGGEIMPGCGEITPNMKILRSFWDGEKY